MKPTPLASPGRGHRAGWLALLSYVEQLTTAISAVHRGGWVHRDIKPENVLIAGKAAKLSDLGIASVIPGFEERVQGLIAESLHVAPVAYLSPEQQQRKVDSQTPVFAESDVYQMGMLFYEMFTNRVALGEIVVL